MCGRLALDAYVPDLEERFEAKADAGLTWEPRFNIPPKSDLKIPIIIQQGSTRIILPALWGLLPRFSKDPTLRMKYSTFNAKLESVKQSRIFAPSVSENLFCLVPAIGFYEWSKTEKNKQPYFIHSRTDKIIALAGLYAPWKTAEDKTPIYSFTIFTTAPNRFMKQYHDRMPALLTRELEEDILDTKNSPDQKLKDLTKTRPFEDWDAYPVDPKHVNYRKEGKECIERARL